MQPAPHPGRYHLVGDPWPMYGSIDEATVWAEWSQATGGGVDPEDDPRWLCTFDADLAVIDLRRPEVLAALGVTIEQLSAAWAPGKPNRACLKVRTRRGQGRGAGHDRAVRRPRRRVESRRVASRVLRYPSGQSPAAGPAATTAPTGLTRSAPSSAPCFP